MSMFAGVRAVLSLAGPVLPAVSFLARLPAAICPIGTLLMLTELDGIGAAGIVAGALLAGQAVSGPVLGRLADRRGQRPVALAASLANAAAIAALVAAVLAGLHVAVEAACAGLVGLTVPQIGALSRSRWVALVDRLPRTRKDGGAELTGRALSFDTTVDEIGFMAGPALAGLAVLLVHPAAAMVLAGGLVAVFGVLFALHPTAPPGSGRRTRGDGPAGRVRLVGPALAVLFALTVLQGMVLGSANAGVSALAQHLGAPGKAGFVWGAMAVTSTLAGVAITLRPSSRDLTTRLRLAVVAQAVLVLPLLLVDGFLGATAVTAAIGLAMAPQFIAVFSLAERVAPVERMSEAMALLGSALIAGQGVAALAAGQFAQAGGHRAAFVLSCAAGASALVTALALVRGGSFRNSCGKNFTVAVTSASAHPSVK